MTEPVYTGGRLRAYLEFLAAFLYFFFARSLAFHGAQGLAGEAWSPLVEQAMLVFLLLIGYAAMGFWIDRQVASHQRTGIAAALRLAARGWAGTGNRLGDRPGLRSASHCRRRHRHLILSAGLIVGLACGRYRLLRVVRFG